MAVQIITTEDLELFRIHLLNDLRDLLKQTSKLEHKQYLRGNEVRKLLNISNGTLQNLRITDVLHPTKIGGILYYKQEEIEALFNVK